MISSTELVRIREEYLAAFKAANPLSSEPWVVYRDGYFRFLSRGSATCLSKHRKSKLIEMTSTLRARAQQESKDA